MDATVSNGGRVVLMAMFSVLCAKSRHLHLWWVLSTMHLSRRMRFNTHELIPLKVVNPCHVGMVYSIVYGVL